MSLIHKKCLVLSVILENKGSGQKSGSIHREAAHQCLFYLTTFNAFMFSRARLLKRLISDSVTFWSGQWITLHQDHQRSGPDHLVRPLCRVQVGAPDFHPCDKIISEITTNGSAVLCVRRCMKTFEVEFGPDHKEFSRINPQDTIFTSYVYSPGKTSWKHPKWMFSTCRTVGMVT